MLPTIRPAQPADRGRLCALFQALNRHEDDLTGDRRTDLAGAEDSLAAAEARVEETGGAMLVAELEGQVVGLLALTFEEGPVYVVAEARPYAHISDLVVDRAHRRKGIGGALMNAAERQALARGYRELCVGVLAGNRGAEAAYASQGFRVFGLEFLKKIAAPE